MTIEPKSYISGFGNFVETEAVPGALPHGRNSPQRAPLGLYAEKFSASAFTAPRPDNFRSWLYRIRPSVGHGPFARIDNGLVLGAPCELPPTTPDQLRWSPLPMPKGRVDFVDGLATVAVNGDLFAQAGLAIHVYRSTSGMGDRYFCNADGEMLFVPELGAIVLRTELGRIDAQPGEIALVPRGIRFQLDPADKAARGYVCENYGAPMKLPERGPIGTDGLANSRDFLIPVAAYEDKSGTCEIITKLGGNLFRCELDHSPLDVVAWHGNLAPCKYDLRRFNTIGSISYDHPDPSIFTVLTSASDTAGVANVDFVVFPPRWLVMENTFRPPWFHRNVMSEYMGLIYGEYDAKAGGGFVPGGASLHNCMSPHGPDATTYQNASHKELAPEKIDNTMAFMFESRYLIRPTRFALETDALQADYLNCWRGLKAQFSIA